ncbi:MULTISPECIES: ABC transporter permease [unclassified Modestobacter]
MRHVPASTVVKRLVAIPVSVFAIATLTFFLIRATGADAAATLAGEYADADAIAQVRDDLGLNDGIWHQYVQFLSDLVRGDLGTSYFSKGPVTDEIFGRLPLDLVIGLLSLLVAVVLGVAAGSIAAYTRDRWPDGVLRVVVSALQSIPEYVLALVAIFVFFYLLGWLPAPVGQLPIGAVQSPDVTHVALIDSALAGNWISFWQALAQLVLPVLSVGVVLAAAFAKVTRSNFTTVLSSPQVQYAKALGLSPWRVYRSAFSVTRSSVLTTVAIVLGVVLGGGSILQKIFTLDGAAAYSVDSIFRLDLPAIQGTVIVFGSLTVLVFLLIDLVIVLTDPRVRQKG